MANADGVPQRSRAGSRRASRGTPATISSTTAAAGLAFACLLLSSPVVPAATTIYRCNGGASYADHPCPDAQPLSGLDDTRSESQRADALAVARREAALAAQMVRDRERSSAAVGGSASSNSRKRRKGSVSSAASALSSATSGTDRTVGSGNGTSSSNRKRPGVDTDEFVAYVPKQPKQAATAKAK